MHFELFVLVHSAMCCLDMKLPLRSKKSTGIGGCVKAVNSLSGVMERALGDLPPLNLSLDPSRPFGLLLLPARPRLRERERESLYPIPSWCRLEREKGLFPSLRTETET